jgi:YbbR domain-containing protein
MYINIKQVFLGNSFLKVSSLIIGYLLWSVVADSYVTSIWVDVPLCFYNNDQAMCVEAPEMVNVQLKGRRAVLYNLDKKSLAIHINIQDLKPGLNPYTLTTKDLFLSPAITLGDYIPYKVIIKLQ